MLAQSLHRPPQITKKNNEDSKKKEINLKFPEIPKFIFNFDKKTSKVSDFVTIQEGCDKFCSFCVVPTRGPEYSRSRKSILMKLNNGSKWVKEIILLGSVNAWKDSSNEGKNYTLGYLIEDIAKIDKFYYTLYYITPSWYGSRIDKSAQNVNKLMPYLHLPVQSGSDKILKKWIESILLVNI